MTTRSTLTSIPNTIFEGMFSGKFLVKPEEDGNFNFILLFFFILFSQFILVLIYFTHLI